MMYLSMRTTLDLDDDILESTKTLANSQGNTIGQVISDLVRLALQQRNIRPSTRNGVPLFVPKPGAQRRPDLQLVNALRDEQ